MLKIVPGGTLDPPGVGETDCWVAQVLSEEDTLAMAYCLYLSLLAPETAFGDTVALANCL